jgi:hypothetical protein
LGANLTGKVAPECASASAALSQILYRRVNGAAAKR